MRRRCLEWGGCHELVPLYALHIHDVDRAVDGWGWSGDRGVLH